MRNVSDKVVEEIKAQLFVL